MIRRPRKRGIYQREREREGGREGVREGERREREREREGGKREGGEEGEEEMTVTEHSYSTLPFFTHNGHC